MDKKINEFKQNIQKTKKDPNILDTENQLSSKIGMRVFIQNKKNKSGTLTFEYKDFDQLDRLIKIVKDNY